VDVWAARGIVGRAVLCDVGRWREAEGRPIDYAEADPIEPDDVRGALAAGGTQVETGDILLLRTGWLRWYRSLDAAGRTALRTGHRAPGLRPGTATAAMLWDLHIAALAADNPAVEVWPPGATLAPDKRDAVRADPERCHEAFVHFSLLALLGLPLGELFDLDALADAVAADGRSACLLTSAPLRLRHGVASPANALAIR
jgi:kynurenine formamidase